VKIIKRKNIQKAGEAHIHFYQAAQSFSLSSSFRKILAEDSKLFSPPA
jgi:hypothetical protein